jgi:hypothetical protein
MQASNQTSICQEIYESLHWLLLSDNPIMPAERPFYLIKLHFIKAVQSSKTSHLSTLFLTKAQSYNDSLWSRLPKKSDDNITYQGINVG